MGQFDNPASEAGDDGGVPTPPVGPEKIQENLYPLPAASASAYVAPTVVSQTLTWKNPVAPGATEGTATTAPVKNPAPPPLRNGVGLPTGANEPPTGPASNSAIQGGPVNSVNPSGPVTGALPQAPAFAKLTVP